MASIYVHIPFCASFCTYCGFYSEIYAPARKGGCPSVQEYLYALEKEISARRDFLEGVPVETIYIGGGTPSVMPGGSARQIADALGAAFDLSELQEFTVEVNPDDICAGDGRIKLRELRACGVDRISMGVQSFSDESLRWMNRRHTAAQAREAFSILRQEGFENISIDLIFGYPLLDMEQWLYSIHEAVALGPEHISAYQLSVDEGSALHEAMEKRRFRPLDDDACAEQYAAAQQALASAGYEQYEISNYCRPGFRSRHNSAYWKRLPYLGLGAAAHSFNGKDLRQWNAADLQRYIAGAPPENEHLTKRDIYNETVMLALRTADGLPASLLHPGTDTSRLQRIAPAESDSHPQGGEARYRIAPADFFIADDIISDLFDE